MKLLIAKSKWEMWDDPLEDFLIRASRDGFDAVEVYLPALEEDAETIRRMVSDHGLRLIAQIITEGHSPSEHLESLEKRFAFAEETQPLFVNAHTGADHFSFEDNLRILHRSCELSSEAGLRFTHETHRGRPLFNIPDTLRFLRALPELQLNADLSHWVCAHESLLENFEDQLVPIFKRCYHIHARVGHPEGPQVPDPLAPEWLSTTGHFLRFWQDIIKVRREAGDAQLTLTCEFGPPPYMPCEPRTQRPLADPWEVNVQFKDFLIKELLQ